jgi:hypothetical protein
VTAGRGCNDDRINLEKWKEQSMKRLTMVLSVIVAASLMGVLAVPATSQPQPERMTITLFGNDTDYEKHVRGSGDPFAPGDWHVYVDRLLDPETCEVAAKIVGRFVFVKRIGKYNGWYINEFTVTRPDGKITAYGGGTYGDFAKSDAVFAVTGGTGAYRDASGDVSFDTETVRLCGSRGQLSTIDIGPAS